MTGLTDQLNLGIPSPPSIELCVSHHAHPLGCHACSVSAFAEPLPQLLEEAGVIVWENIAREGMLSSAERHVYTMQDSYLGSARNMRKERAPHSSRLPL